MLGSIAWLLVAVVLFLVLGVVTLLASAFDWTLWPTIRRARRELIRVARQRCPNATVFSQQGATKIDPRYLGFLIKTNTDEERQAASRPESLRAIP